MLRPASALRHQLAFLFLCALYFSACKHADVYQIGCIAPLTGEGNYGRATRQGVEFATGEINQSHYLSKPLQVVFEDDKMTPREGVNALRKLITANRVPIVIGPFGSSVVLACAPIANENRTIIISGSATADSIAKAGDYVFRITPPNSKQGFNVAEYARSALKANVAAVIFQNNDYGVSLRDAFVARFSALGGSIAGVETVETGATDLRSQILRLQAVKPQIVFFPLHYGEAGLFLKQASELGLKADFISADGAMTDGTLKIAGPAAEGTYYSTLALGYGVADPEIQNYQRRFKAKYGNESDVYTAYYYELTKIVAKAIKEGGDDSESIKQTLYAMHGPKSYHGITGTTSFNKDGEVDKNFLIYRVVGGRFTLAK
jgi:branched-chain amino acid transport system substrate-binding protein